MQNKVPHHSAGKIIHVPQGKSGRLHSASGAYGISGLYTCEFTTCNILAFIGPTKLLLIHADLLTDIREESKWIEEELQEVVLIYRQGYENALTIQMRPFLQERFGEKLKVISMDDAHDGVHLSFELNLEGFHGQIRKFALRVNPPNLIRHPYEQLLVAVQKIEQVIGLNAKHRTGKSRKRYMTVYDGRAWEAMEEWELKVDVTHPATKEEINFFLATDDYLKVCGKLTGIVNSLQGRIPILEDLKELVMPIAFQLEGYLNNFNAPKLFIRNIKILFDEKLENSVVSMTSPTSLEDVEICKQIRKENSVEDVIALFEKYRDMAPATPFKKELMDCFDTCHRHYQERMRYTIVENERRVLKERFENHVRKAILHSQKQEYEAAKNLFFDALKIASECFLKDDPALASAYWNFGRILQRSGDGENAMFFIHIALQLREAYQRKEKQLIKKTRKALSECEDMVKKSVEVGRPLEIKN